MKLLLLGGFIITPKNISSRSTRNDLGSVNESKRTSETFKHASKELRQISLQLRTIGLGLQADRLDRLADDLEPPAFKGILTSLHNPQQWPTPHLVEMLARWVTEGAHIIREMMPDAEITGSIEILDQAKAWLEDLDL